MEITPAGTKGDQTVLVTLFGLTFKYIYIEREF